VVVVGAGPAGLEAAVTAAERGCSVVLFEAADTIGGQLNLAAQPPGKNKMNWIMDFYTEAIAALGIELHLNTPATPELIAASAPTAVIIAAGSVPIAPRAIPGLDGDNVCLPPEVLRGEVDLTGKRVCVIGSGMTGIETTDLLTERGCELTLYEMMPDIGPGVYFQNMMYIMPRLGAHGVQFFPSHKLLAIEGNSARFERVDKTVVTQEADFFVVSLGTRPNLDSINPLIEAYPHAILVGDANKPGRITAATHDGWTAARTVAL
jgi:NADPH-dependent 2,4-dienoyl-CoA reductase/sulfur reductase-like enzyme